MLDINAWLSFPAVYELFSRLVGAKKSRTIHVNEYIRPKPGDNVLDIGCGTADILSYLPRVDYWGFDINRRYIESAIKRFGDRGHFYCSSVSRREGDKKKDFDIVLANGVLHHLDDNAAIELFNASFEALKSGGRLVTLDNCYGEGQSRIARYFISKDRGRYIRTKNEYVNLATAVFTDCKASIRHDLLRIPYTHIILECTK